jgi:hypothetical protein
MDCHSLSTRKLAVSLPRPGLESWRVIARKGARAEAQ